MASQSDLNWFKSFQKRSLKTTFAQGLQKGPIPTPLNLENRAPVQAPALFSLSQPCPKRCPKSSQKRSQGTLKSTRNLNKTVFNKELQIDTDSLSCFWSQKGIQSAIENRLDEKIPPAPSQRPMLECFWVARRCFFCYLSCFRSVISSVPFSSCRDALNSKRLE